MLNSNPTSNPNTPTGSPGVSTSTLPRPSWTFQLQTFCTAANLRRPIYNDVSDRRGGRTAWSTAVDVEGTHYTARFWYDGRFQNNAREDAAEVALGFLRGNVVQQPQRVPSPVPAAPRPEPPQDNYYTYDLPYRGSNGGNRFDFDPDQQQPPQA